MKIVNHLIGTVGTTPFYSDGRGDSRGDSAGDPSADGRGDPGSDPWSGLGAPGSGGRPDSFESRPMASFRLAVNYSAFDQSTGAWRDIDTTWFDVVCFGELAENVRKCVNKGEKVMVVGRILEKQWTSQRTGVQGKTLQIRADAVGHNLRNAMAMVVKPAPAQEPAESRPDGEAGTSPLGPARDDDRQDYDGAQYDGPESDASGDRDDETAGQLVGAAPAGGERTDDHPPF